MRKFSFENPEIMDILNHQAIHMDQAVTYCPEYIVTGATINYPSRTAQIIRAVYLGELEASEYGARAVFTPILSGQGERWQNFGELPDGYFISIVLGRELFLSKGFGREAAEIIAAKETAADDDQLAVWKEMIPSRDGSRLGLLLDEGTFKYAGSSRENLADFLQAKNICVNPDYTVYDTGFDDIAVGRIDQGISKIEKILDDYKKAGITRVLTLSGQAQYVFTRLLPYLGIETEIEFISILDLADKMDVKNAYIYGGSFYTRYLRMEKRFNDLAANTEETPLLSHPEFQPQVEGDVRRNIVGIWTPPISAEYQTAGTPGSMEDSLYDLAIGEIEKTSFGILVVCDPYAMKKLNDKGYTKAVYYLDVLK